MSSLSQLSILIVTYKRDDLLLDCLRSIKASCSQMPQIVVVDNAALDSTQQVIEKFGTACYVRSENNLGFAGGNNLGLPYCTGSFIFLLNNDTVIHEEPFSYMMDYLEDHPEVGLIAAKTRLPQANNLLGGYVSYLTPFGVQYSQGICEPDGPKYQVPLRSFAVGGACMMFRETVLSELQGVLFYDHFKSYYEDVDFSHRVWLAGFEVQSLPTPIVDHICNQTGSLFPRVEIITQYYKNIWFSFLTCFGFYGYIRVLPLFSILVAGHAFMQIMKGNKPLFMAHVNALRDIWKMRAEIRKTRKQIQSSRKISDWKLFRMIMKQPPLKYYWDSIWVHVKHG